jgi:hypothetical protein
MAWRTSTWWPRPPACAAACAAWRAVHTASGEPSGVQTTGVLGRRLGRPGAQDDAVQDRPPHEARDLDHARVAQELGQVAPQGRRGGRVGRAQVDQQHGRAGRWPWGRAVRRGSSCRARRRAAQALEFGGLGPAPGEAAWRGPRSRAVVGVHRRPAGRGGPARRAVAAAGESVGVGQVQVDDQQSGPKRPPIPAPRRLGSPAQGRARRLSLRRGVDAVVAVSPKPQRLEAARSGTSKARRESGSASRPGRWCRCRAACSCRAAG